MSPSPARRYLFDDEDGVAEPDEFGSERVLRFPERSWTDREAEEFEPEQLPRPRAAARRRRRGRRQVVEQVSARRYALTAAAFVAAVAVLAGLILSLTQTGRPGAASSRAALPQPQVQASTVQPPQAVQQAQAVPEASSPAPAAEPRGQGAVRVTSREVEPSYTVASGDTLGSIAARFGISVEALQSINNLADRNVLSVGQKLIIPNQR